MKYILLTFFLLFTVTKSSEVDKKYYLHTAVKQTLNDEKQKALDLWIDFLYEDNDTIRREYWNTPEVEKYGDDYCLFQSGYFQFDRLTQLTYFVPYILSIEKIESDIVIRTMFTGKEMSLSDTAIRNQLPTGIIRIKVIPDSKGIRLSNLINDETQNWNRYKTKNINYIVNNSIEIDKKQCDNAQNFIDSISTLWGKISNKTIDYYVSNSSESINRLIGSEFAFYGGVGNGVASSNGSYLLVGNKDYNYKHELAHIVFNGTTNRLLSEGITTYFGGTNGKNYSEVKREFLENNSPLTLQKITDISGYPGQKNYYVLGAVLCELVIKQKGIAGIKAIWEAEGSGDRRNGLGDYNTVMNGIEKMLNLTEQDVLERVGESK